MAAGRRTLGTAILILALTGVVYALYRLLDEHTSVGPESPVGQWLLPALSLALVVFASLLFGVLVTNLVRLISDRKKGILGSRLRSKLVFFFLALVLAPAIVLFIGSAQVIKETVEAILRTPIELNRASKTIVDEWREYFQLEATEARREELAALLEASQFGADKQWIRVHSDGRLIASSGSLDARLSLGEDQQLLDDLAARVESGSPIGARIDYLDSGILIHASAPVMEGEVTLAVVSVGILVPERLAQAMRDFTQANQEYRQFRADRRRLVRFYVTLIAIIFLVTMSIATWVGFYVSKRITEPIQELAAASREISAGNLDVRVRTNVGDEMALLVDSFNDMAAELQESRTVITRSTADLRRSNRELDERRRYIEALLANLSTGVISLDPSGRVTTANPASELILGLDLNAGDDPVERLEEVDLHSLAVLFASDTRVPNDGMRRDMTLDRPLGGINVSVQVTRFRSGADEPLGTLVMVEDLSELMRAQRAAAWREVARRIAHEIKNPLTPIQLAAQRLRKKFDEGSEDLAAVLPVATASIEREVGALKKLVDEFSRFARMPEVRPREVRFSSVVQPVLDLYEGVGAVQIEVELEDSVDLVRVDPDQMRRVLINLVDNAVAAMDRAGRIWIRARRCGPADLLQVEICDDGPGIDPQDRDKLFSPYFSTKKRGTGLGLAIVHRVVTDHQGTIRIEDNEPTGARFVIEMPA
jgi:two-component system nitrogen regulation sensor histidine kinase NtrY